MQPTLNTWRVIVHTEGRVIYRNYLEFFCIVSHHPCIAAAAAKSLQSCPTLWDPIDVSPPGSPVPGILQASTLECVAISFSNAWKWKVKGKSLSCVQLSATLWTSAHQAFPSMGFSRQEYWSGVPLPLYWVGQKVVPQDVTEKSEWKFWPTQYFLSHWWISVWTRGYFTLWIMTQ